MRTDKKNYMQDKSRTPGILLIQAALFSIIPVFAFYAMEFMDRNPFEQIRFKAHFFNIILFELLAWILYFLLGRAKWALRILLAGTLVMGLINHYVTEFRSTPFVPWDIFSVRTAASVASNYDFTLPARILIIILLFTAVFILVHFMDFRMTPVRRFRQFLLRFIPAAFLTAGLVFFAGRLQDSSFQTANYLYPYLFTPNVMVKYDGYAVTFTMDLAYLFVDKPDGYSEKEAEETLASYKTGDASDTDVLDAPNIIVIMDEAFSDLSVLGDFETNEDYMPFLHSLMNGGENTVSGFLNVSVCGGNTADTEYEFLTGNTMAFLPTGSIPYQQYIRGEIPTLASQLAVLGYATYAQHPYYGSGWNRETVYPLMGFANLAFYQDYSNVRILRKYVSDETDFEKIIETYENKEFGQPAFIFNVTMQNHGGYTDTFEGFTNEVTAEKLDNSALDQYLSLLKITDSDLENLISYFSQADEKTIIVFFGDHQPNDTVAASVLAENGMNYKELTDEQLELRYQVPYIIWANYDIEEQSGQDTSVNYLGTKLLEIAGLPLSDYNNFLAELKEDYPIISSVRTEQAEDADSSLLETYKKLQYYRMFDYKMQDE